MNFINDQNRARLFAEFAHNGLHAGFKITPVPRSGKQCSHIQRIDGKIPEAVRHPPLRYAQGQPLGHGCLARTRLAYQKGIVFASPGKHFHQTGKFPLPSHQRIDSALTGQLHQIPGIFFQSRSLRAVSRSAVRSHTGMRVVHSGDIVFKILFMENLRQIRGK